MRAVKMLFVLMLISLLSSALLPTYAQGDKPKAVGLRPDAPPYAVHGPYWVGTMAMDAKTKFHPTKIQVWYPAKNLDGKPETITYGAGPEANLPILGHAILNAELEPAKGPYPLIIYAHGLGGGIATTVFLCEHLASQGFIVLAIDYADSMDMVEQSDPALSMFTRPIDISWQIDYAGQLNANKDGKLHGMIDTDHIAVVGHSYGGYTALMTAGAQLDIKGKSGWCLQYPNLRLVDELGGGTLQERFCAHADQVAKLAGLPSVPEGLWPSWGDPRVDAIVPLAPWVPFFGSESTKNVAVPTLLMFGTKDRFVWTELPLYQTYAYSNLSSTVQSQVAFEQGDHALFMNGCDAAPGLIGAGLHWACSDPVWDMDRAHDLINHFTTAFLLDVLKGDKDAHKTLLPDAVKFVGIQYKTTMK